MKHGSNYCCYQHAKKQKRENLYDKMAPSKGNLECTWK